MVVLVDLIVWFFGFELPTGELRIEDVYPKESSIFSLQKLKWNIFTIWVVQGVWLVIVLTQVIEVYLHF